VSGGIPGRRFKPRLRALAAVWLLTLAVGLGLRVPSGPLAGGRSIPLRPGLSPSDHLTANLEFTNLAQALAVYGNLTGRLWLPRTNTLLERLDTLTAHRLSRWGLVRPAPVCDSGVRVHRDGLFSAREARELAETFFLAHGVAIEPVGTRYLRVAATNLPPARPVARGPEPLLGRGGN
jgi:hypothetical protein